jgi:hypothetical protein
VTFAKRIDLYETKYGKLQSPTRLAMGKHLHHAPSSATLTPKVMAKTGINDTMNPDTLTKDHG